MEKEILKALKSLPKIVPEQKTIIMNPKDFDLMGVEEYKIDGQTQLMGMKLKLSEFIERGKYCIYPMTKDEMEKLRK